MLSEQDMQHAYTAAVGVFACVGDSSAINNVIVVDGNAHWDAIAAWLLAFTRKHSVTLVDSAGNILAHRFSAVSTAMH